ncbi:MAG: tyrosine-type recombinase/integrase [bacterium]|nr:tyrosine-type recombinase/integrase [bacterium]
MNLQKQLEDFIKFLKSQSKASATVIAYTKDISQVIAYLEKEQKTSWEQATTVDLQGFLTGLAGTGYTPKSVSRKINSIKTFFRFLVTQKIVNNNASTAIVHPKFDTKTPRILSGIEYRALRDACREDVRISAVVELLLQTGMRIGELASLTTDSIKIDSIVIPPVENHTEREVPLNHAVKAALEVYLAQRPKIKSSALFITKTGRPFLIRNIRTSIDRYFKLAGIKDAKVNDLRHTFIAYHLASGASPVLIAKLAGHKRISTTEKYLEYIKDLPVEKVKLEEL